MDAFLTSVLLVVATGAVSLLVAWQQNRFAVRRAQLTRAEQLEDSRREASLEDARALLSALQEIVDVAMSARLAGDGLPPRAEYGPALAVAREKYLLVADADTRNTIADGLTVLASGAARGVPVHAWHEAAATTCFILAAYIRGDELPPSYVERLSELRGQYAQSS
jgi:hypothetical protein